MITCSLILKFDCNLDLQYRCGLIFNNWPPRWISWTLQGHFELTSDLGRKWPPLQRIRVKNWSSPNFPKTPLFPVPKVGYTHLLALFDDLEKLPNYFFTLSETERATGRMLPKFSNQIKIYSSYSFCSWLQQSDLSYRIRLSAQDGPESPLQIIVKVATLPIKWISG